MKSISDWIDCYCKQPLGAPIVLKNSSKPSASVSLTDSRQGFGLVSILVHWVSALTIIFLFGLGVYMRGLGYYDEWYHKGPALHISIGLLLTFLIVLRVVWRVSNSTPEPLSSERLLNLGAKLVKVGLYVFIFTVLCTGYLITTADGKPAEMFNWISFPAFYELSAKGVDLAGWLHKYVAWGIIGLAVLHAGGAFMHHFIKRDRTLVRMLKPVAKEQL